MFFYNSSTRAAATGKLDADGSFISLKDIPSGFGAWTHIVAVDNKLFFYNSSTRAAATGRLDDDGGFTSLKDIPSGFGAWTHIVGAGFRDILGS